MSFQTMQQGWGQQSPAAMQIIRQGIGAARSIVRRTRSKTRSASLSTRRARKPKRRYAASGKRSGSSRKLARLVKGSAAAKAYMAKIRKKRR